MATLKEKLPLPNRRNEMVDACCGLLDDEVNRKKGVGGLLVKTSYKVFKSFNSNAVRSTVDALFDEFVDALEPFHTEYLQGSKGRSFGSFLKTRIHSVAEALVSVTDRRADRTKHQSLRKAYHSLRSSAVRHVEEAIPGLASVMDSFYKDN